jgi:hypothetical protein
MARTVRRATAGQLLRFEDDLAVALETDGAFASMGMEPAWATTTGASPAVRIPARVAGALRSKLTLSL